MRYRWALPIVAIALLSSLAWGSDAPKPAASVTKYVAMDMVAKIKVGSSTREKVAELLGTPWRVVNDEDCHPVDYQGETWEYLGHDADGSFKVSVQFDTAGIARLISKSTAKGPVVVLAAAPPPNASHQH
ncbi:MAG TPA: outer membrane protein assembly factor BamE [Candidatus Angelobacter sp.]